MACETCKGDGKITTDGVPYSVIAEKEGKRPGWVGLLSRTTFHPCPHCGRSSMPPPVEKPPFESPPVEEEAPKRRGRPAGSKNKKRSIW